MAETRLSPRTREISSSPARFRRLIPGTSHNPCHTRWLLRCSARRRRGPTYETVQPAAQCTRAGFRTSLRLGITDGQRSTYPRTTNRPSTTPCCTCSQECRDRRRPTTTAQPGHGCRRIGLQSSGTELHRRHDRRRPGEASPRWRVGRYLGALRYPRRRAVGRYAPASNPKRKRPRTRKPPCRRVRGNRHRPTPTRVRQEPAWR